MPNCLVESQFNVCFFIAAPTQDSITTNLCQHLVETFEKFTPVDVSRHNTKWVDVGAFRVNSQTIWAEGEQFTTNPIQFLSRDLNSKIPLHSLIKLLPSPPTPYEPTFEPTRLYGVIHRDAFATPLHSRTTRKNSNSRWAKWRVEIEDIRCHKPDQWVSVPALSASQ